MTINIKPPREFWELSANTYFSREGAATRPNVKPANFGENQPHPKSRLFKVVGAKEVADDFGKRVLRPALAKDGHPTARHDAITGITSWTDLEVGNRAIYFPYQFALSADWNFSNSTVSFLNREDGIYWLTPDQLRRYFEGERLFIAGSKQFITIDEIREPTLFDHLGEEWAL
ncbi:hypothetical protein [Curtobacterium flaccumfaciens]|uniref:hypothetical protein n=1 Tax=Curtobacterium flaccumfaciens TaxID=2035 RepID=UPI0038793146